MQAASPTRSCAPDDLPPPLLSETIPTAATLLRWDVFLRAQSFRYCWMMHRPAIGNPGAWRVTG